MSLGRAIIELEEQISASLWIKPATMDDLMEREFLQNYSAYWIELILWRLQNAGRLYVRSKRVVGVSGWPEEVDTYYCYKREAERLNGKGYEL